LLGLTGGACLCLFGSLQDAKGEIERLAFLADTAQKDYDALYSEAERFFENAREAGYDIDRFREKEQQKAERRKEFLRFEEDDG
jgi:hypothetical protein